MKKDYVAGLFLLCCSLFFLILSGCTGGGAITTSTPTATATLQNSPTPTLPSTVTPTATPTDVPLPAIEFPPFHQEVFPISELYPTTYADLEPVQPGDITKHPIIENAFQVVAEYNNERGDQFQLTISGGSEELLLAYVNELRVYMEAIATTPIEFERFPPENVDNRTAPLLTILLDVIVEVTGVERETVVQSDQSPTDILTNLEVDPGLIIELTAAQFIDALDEGMLSNIPVEIQERIAAGEAAAVTQELLETNALFYHFLPLDERSLEQVLSESDQAVLVEMALLQSSEGLVPSQTPFTVYYILDPSVTSTLTPPYNGYHYYTACATYAYAQVFVSLTESSSTFVNLNFGSPWQYSGATLGTWSAYLWGSSTTKQTFITSISSYQKATYTLYGSWYGGC